MTSRLFAIATLTLLLPLPTASAQELSAKELKKAVRQADKAFAAGQTEHAAELYGQILASTSAGDSRRESALYGLAMVQLSAGSTEGDFESAGRYLEELTTTSPRHLRRVEIAAARGLLDEIEAVRARSAQRDAELRAQLEAERQAAEAERDEFAGESEAAGGKVKSLEAQLRRMRAERNECQGELEKKEVALQKLKDALVARAGGSG